MRLLLIPLRFAVFIPFAALVIVATRLVSLACLRTFSLGRSTESINVGKRWVLSLWRWVLGDSMAAEKRGRTSTEGTF
jgi:hypothetical protein